MLALSGNEILAATHAEFGPIDPQLRFPHEGRIVSVPAQAALDQFDHAYSEIGADPKKLTVWLPILRQYGPSFLQECLNAISMSQQLVTEWLETYMFSGETDAGGKAARVSEWLGNHNNFNTHSRRVGAEQLLRIEPTLRISPLQDIGEDFATAVIDLYWALDITFNETGAFKIIEHHAGSAYVRLSRTAVLGAPPQAARQPTNPAGPTRAEGAVANSVAEYSSSEVTSSSYQKLCAPHGNPTPTPLPLISCKAHRRVLTASP